MFKRHCGLLFLVKNNGGKSLQEEEELVLENISPRLSVRSVGVPVFTDLVERAYYLMIRYNLRTYCRQSQNDATLLLYYLAGYGYLFTGKRCLLS